MVSILLITPDRSFAEYATQALSSVGHYVVTVESSDQAVRTALSVPIDLVVADTLSEELPELREQIDSIRRVPFVFVSHSPLPIREGDRFLSKPASAEHLCDAVAAVMAGDLQGPEVNLAGLTFKRPGQRIHRGDPSEQLTPIEFRLLQYLASSRGNIVSAQDLLEHVWNYTHADALSEVVRSHLKNLRAKVRCVNAGQDIIETIPRRGCRLSTSARA